MVGSAAEYASSILEPGPWSHSEQRHATGSLRFICRRRRIDPNRDCHQEYSFCRKEGAVGAVDDRAQPSPALRI